MGSRTLTRNSDNLRHQRERWWPSQFSVAFNTTTDSSRRPRLGRAFGASRPGKLRPTLEPALDPPEKCRGTALSASTHLREPRSGDRPPPSTPGGFAANRVLADHGFRHDNRTASRFAADARGRARAFVGTMPRSMEDNQLEPTVEVSLNCDSANLVHPEITTMLVLICRCNSFHLDSQTNVDRLVLRCSPTKRKRVTHRRIVVRNLIGALAVIRINGSSIDRDGIESTTDGKPDMRPGGVRPIRMCK